MTGEGLVNLSIVLSLNPDELASDWWVVGKPLNFFFQPFNTDYSIAYNSNEINTWKSMRLQFKLWHGISNTKMTVKTNEREFSHCLGLTTVHQPILYSIFFQTIEWKFISPFI